MHKYLKVVPGCIKSLRPITFGTNETDQLEDEFIKKLILLCLIVQYRDHIAFNCVFYLIIILYSISGVKLLSVKSERRYLIPILMLQRMHSL